MSKKTHKLAVNVDKRRKPKGEEARKLERQKESRVLNAQRRASERDVTSNVNDRCRRIDWERREECSHDLALFAKTYFGVMCSLDWSDNHIVAIERMQYSIENGGQFAFAMPRGEGKTSLSEIALIWASLYRKRRYIVLIAAKEGKARELMKDIKMFLRHNTLLKKDFPEVLYPIECINNNARKAETQTYNGEPTEITWVANKLVLPTLLDFEYAEGIDSAIPCGILETAGITGDIRGRHHTLPSGEIIRPDFVIVDDPQTAEAAKSPDQCKARIKILNADILGLAGPDQKISAFMPCTVIENNDMAEQVLNDPNWHGERSAMIVTWPEELKTLWQEYNEVRLLSNKKMDKGESARAFYKKHKKKLEKGAKVSWEARIRKGELTALHTAMNLFFEQGERAFYSEYQNQPLSEFANLLDIEPHMVREAANGSKALEVPPDCQFLTAMIDINTVSGLHYTVLASTNSMEVHCPYYGRYPEDTNQSLWTREHTGGLTEAQAIHKAILTVVKTISELHFHRGGQRMHIDMISVDCGYQKDTVFKACAVVDADTPHTKVVASRGHANKYWKETNVIGRPGDNVYRSNDKIRGGAVVHHNADYWRERVHQAFLLGAGAPGSITLFGKEDVHEYYSEHICGERLVEHFQTEKDEYYNWQKVPGRKNDLLDTTVGALALFSVLGASFDGALRMNVTRSGPAVQAQEASYTVL